MNNIPDASTRPSFSKHIDREGARKLIGQSVTKPDTKDRSGSGGKRATFTGDDLVQIAQAVVDKAPFLEPHVERRGKAPTHHKSHVMTAPQSCIGSVATKGLSGLKRNGFGGVKYAKPNNTPDLPTISIIINY